MIETMPEISNVTIYPLTGFNNLKAMASVNYRGVILRGLRVMEQYDSLHIGMPSRRRGERWEDIYFFPDMDTRKRVRDAVVEAYEKEIRPLGV